MAAPDRSLRIRLLDAAGLLDGLLLERLERAGWPSLSRNQSLVLARLDDAPATPADLARRLGVSRQSMQKLLEHLAEAGFVETAPHPSDSRSKLARLSTEGEAFAAAAARIIDGFERRLEAAFGFDTMWTVRRVLDADWSSLLATNEGQNASGR